MSEGGLLRWLLTRLGWLPRQQTRKPITRKTPIRRSRHKEKYDFSDGHFALETLVEEVKTGQVQPAPKLKGFEYDFGSWSPSSTIRSILTGCPQPQTLPYPVERPPDKYDFSYSSKRPPTAGITPASNVEPLTPEDEKFRANFGCEGTTKRKKVFRTLTEEEKQRLDPRKIDNYYFGADFEAIRPRIREKTPYLSHDHMMLGDRYFQRQPETKEPTIKDKWETTEKWQERYWFGT